MLTVLNKSIMHAATARRGSVELRTSSMLCSASSPAEAGLQVSTLAVEFRGLCGRPEVARTVAAFSSRSADLRLLLWVLKVLFDRKLETSASPPLDSRVMLSVSGVDSARIEAVLTIETVEGPFGFRKLASMIQCLAASLKNASASGYSSCEKVCWK